MSNKIKVSSIPLEDAKIGAEDLVSVKKMGNHVELCMIEKRNTIISIQKLDKDHYMRLDTGEVQECNHIANRSENTQQVAQSLKRLREIINTNVTDIDKCKWVTLTYKENMTDTDKLYLDFKNFIKRLRYRYGHFEYIVSMEPQGRGAWHAHVILIFNSKAPFIPKELLEEIWGHGFVNIKDLIDVDNIGAYLSAYLGDIEEKDFKKINEPYCNGDIKIVEKEQGKKLKVPKKYVKGGRLFFYPPGFNIYRMSRGIKKPTKEYMSYHVAKEKIGLTEPTFTKAINITTPDNKFSNNIIYEYYNKNRQSKQ